MAPTDFPALVKAWRGGDEPASAVPALLATLRRALGAATASAWRDTDTDPHAPRWHEPPGAPAPAGNAPALDVPLRADGEVVGRLRVVAVSGASPFDDDARELAAFAADLLAQGLARDRLRQRAARLGEVGDMQRAILDGADYAVIATDTQGVITSFNAAASRMLGYAPQEVIGRHSPAIFHDPEEVERRAAELSTQLAAPVPPGFEVFVCRARRGEADEREWTYVRKDGSRLPVRLSVTAVRGGDGAINGFMGIAADLSERQLARENLRDSEARYHSLFEGTGDSIFLMRGEQFVDCNPATLKMFGCTREQIIGQPPYRYSPEFQPDGRRSDEKAVEKITAAFGGTTQNFEWLHCKYDGTPFDAEVTLNVVEIRGEPHLLATVRDHSERKRAEAELALSRRTLLARNESLRLINQLSTRLHGSLEIDKILAITVEALRSLSPTPHVAICLHEDGQPLRVAASRGFAAAALAEGEANVAARGLHELALARKRLLVSANFAGHDALPADARAALARAGAQSGVVSPLLYRDIPLGSIVLLFEQARVFGEIELDSFTAIGNTVALALASARHVDGLEYLAHHDSLTGLPNRMFLHREFAAALAGADPTRPGAVLMLLDLDRFKEINDTLGHHVGDKLLQQIGPRLKSALRGETGAILCRLGGDEFALLVPGASTALRAQAIASEVLSALRQPYLIEGMQLLIDASVGIAFYPTDGGDSHALLRSADVAMYEAKRKGGGHALYDRSLDQYTPERLSMIADLDGAIRERQLVLHYQPKLDLRDGRHCGFEALVRWDHPRLGLLEPDSFLPLAELGETIHPLTDLVLDLALAQLRRWHDEGLSCSIAVNLSARNLIDDRCEATLRELLVKYRVEPSSLELEITETALMHDPDQAAERLDRIAALGVRIAIDDYGTGYSSLGYLHRLPIHALKIDRLFVRNLAGNEHDAIIVRSTVALAHSLGLEVVAEGVEDARTRELLQGMGCDQIQGYYLSRPLPPEQLGRFLHETVH
jgi:diguanylate cyclase (GGDEF)-like protein/PAS domain S-box-containing protein